MCTPNKLRNSKSTMTLMDRHVAPSTCGVTTCQEYSEVWEPDDDTSDVNDQKSVENKSDIVTRVLDKSDNMTRVSDTCQLDSVAQDSGISSTSDSTISYSTKNINIEMEDLSKVPWYEAEMPR